MQRPSSTFKFYAPAKIHIMDTCIDGMDDSVRCIPRHKKMKRKGMGEGEGEDERSMIVRERDSIDRETGYYKSTYFIH